LASITMLLLQILLCACYNSSEKRITATKMDTLTVITIDGPAGAGKSTLGEQLAEQLGYLYFDTGIMYRALTWAALYHGIDLADGTAVSALARALNIQVQRPHVNDGRQYSVFIADQDITWDLRSPDVEANVSLVARYPEVREVLRTRQRQIGEGGRVVMVGRDIGSIVMPDAQHKIYLLASLEERARRRTAELLARGSPVDIEQIRSDIARRDQQDQHVMQPAPDAMILVSDGYTPDELVARVLHSIGASNGDLGSRN
jgi:CMP/dCMP kinase